MSRCTYPANQVWSDVSRHGSLQDKLDNKVLLAQDRADVSRCVYEVKGFPCLWDYVLSLPCPAPALLQCEQCCPESLAHFCRCSAMPAVFLSLPLGFRKNSVLLLLF